MCAEREAWKSKGRPDGMKEKPRRTTWRGRLKTEIQVSSFLGLKTQ